MNNIRYKTFILSRKILNKKVFGSITCNYAEYIFRRLRLNTNVIYHLTCHHDHLRD